MSRMMFVVFISLLIAACSQPLGPKVFGQCLASANSVQHAEAVHKFLISESEDEGLHVRDFTAEFRALENNESLVFLRVSDRWILPRFRAEFKINPTYGGSRVTVYSAHDERPSAIIRLIKALEDDFNFSVQPEDAQTGGCDKGS